MRRGAVHLEDDAVARAKRPRQSQLRLESIGQNRLEKRSAREVEPIQCEKQVEPTRFEREVELVQLGARLEKQVAQCAKGVEQCHFAKSERALRDRCLGPKELAWKAP